MIGYHQTYGETDIAEVDIEKQCARCKTGGVITIYCLPCLEIPNPEVYCNGLASLRCYIIIFKIEEVMFVISNTKMFL